MGAPSSTSSSEDHGETALQRLVQVRQRHALGLAAVIALAFIALLELRLAVQGFGPTVVDSPELWAVWRREANRLGPSALVFVGASRFQLGIDLPTVRRLSGLEPVQLAIDGSTPLPVLEQLADDPGFRGRVVVDLYWDLISGEDRRDTTRTYLAAYARQPEAPLLPSFEVTEAWLQRQVRWSLASYADGASPWQSLLLRALSNTSTPAYLVSSPDRSWAADYTKVQMPAFALTRAARNLELGPWDYPGPRRAETVAELNAAVAGIRSPSSTSDAFNAGVARIAAAAGKLRARGSQVFLVEMPQSGYVQAIEARRYPKALYWDVLHQRMQAESVPSVSGLHTPALQGFACPDGSHLDRRDRKTFTTALLRTLGLSADNPGS